ncbi:hypothetical protein CMEL01_13470 [Colletotrichum melonis]|uniref:Uncharacterized protein n=1 Tax=Colletotrichum melonis TaxID=1209925 RepID=A0AAI9URJ5_9PEZI|nr:hypothetical protein CMEL01_13470 [Colletotrichum melonis]
MLHTGVVATGVLSLGIGGNKMQRTPPHTTRLGDHEAGSTWIGLAWPARGMNPNATDPASVTLRLAGDGRFRSIRNSGDCENGRAMRLKGVPPFPSVPTWFLEASFHERVSFQDTSQRPNGKSGPHGDPSKVFVWQSGRTFAPNGSTNTFGFSIPWKSGVDGSVVWKLGWSTLAMRCGVQLAGLVGGGYSVLHLARLPVRQAIRDVLAWRTPM